jgi:hypothetical protein
MREDDIPMERKLWTDPFFEGFKSLKSCLYCLNKFSAALGALPAIALAQARQAGL